MRREVLSNGLRVIVKSNPLSPAVAVRLCLHTGSVHDPRDKEGTALLTGLLLEEGTKKRSGEKIADWIDFVGAETDVAVDAHATILLGSMMRGDLEKLLRIFREMIVEPTFPMPALRRIQGQIVSGIQEDDHDTRAVAGRMLRQSLYRPAHPYRRSSSGTRKSVSRITRRDIARFHADHYHPNGGILVIVGDINERETLRRVKTILGNWKAKGDPFPPAVADAHTPNRIRIKTKVLKDKSQNDFQFGYVGIPRLDDDFYNAVVMNQILGAFGIGGRLGARIREKEGLAYYVGSGFRPSVGAGPFVVAGGVGPDHVGRAVQVVLEEIDRIRQQKVTRMEMADTKRFLIDSLPLRLETNEGIAAFLLNEEYYNLGPDYLKQYKALVESVDRESVLTVARRLLRTDAYSLAVAGPELPKPLEEVLA